METILSYLDNMFLNLPKTEEVLKVKKELALMMEDKYNELLAEGKKKNEAIGIVISEFGDLKELQEELGLGESIASVNSSDTKNSFEEREKATFKKEPDEQNTRENKQEQNVRYISREEVQNYRETEEKAANGISYGVMLCICSPVFLLVCATFEEIMDNAFSNSVYIFGGVIPLFLMIGIAVALFITNASRLERYEYLKKENFVIDEIYLMELGKTRESEKRSAMMKITIGVVLCIFSVIPVLVASCFQEYMLIGSVFLLLLLVAVAVRFFIIGGMQLECMKVLFQEEEFSSDAKKNNKIMDAIAEIYWPVIVAVYLIWSFVTGRWGHTWIIWPIAGVVFGLMAIIFGVIEKLKEN